MRAKSTLSKSNTGFGVENEIKRLAAIVEHSRDAIISLDLEGNITSWNKGAERVYGYNREDAIGRDIVILAPHERIEELRSNLRSTMLGEEISEFETVRKNKSGKEVFVSLTTSAVRDNEDNIIGISIIARDISDRKEKERELIVKYEELSAVYEELSAAEEELRHNYLELEVLREEAEYANKAKSRFLANMSHEIRTPMNGVICIAELLSYTELNEQQHEYVNMLKSSSESLLEIVNNLLDISKIELGRYILKKERFNLEDSIFRVVNRFRLVSQNKGIEMFYSIEPSLKIDLIGDSLRLNRVLINLVNNAMKFTERGSIFIRVKKVDSKDDRVRLLFSVEDTGIGISDEVKNKLFKVFSQGDDSYTKKYRGTGLGLAISKEIVRMMNGEIWVDSKEGQGSTFCFTAEFSIDNAGTDSNHIEIKASTQLTSESNGYTDSAVILIVEDNIVN